MRTFFNFILIFSLPLVGWADFSAQVDRRAISINETLTLTLSVDSQVDTRAIDLSVLGNEFDILGTSPQSSVSIINGRQSALTRWVITLLPKTTGSLTIPAFNLNGETTNPIRIDVAQVSQRVGDNPINAQLEVQDSTIYVNEEMVITISLITSPQVSSLSGEQLNIDNADATLLDQRNFSRVVNGENWQVNQWQYAVFSRSPGMLHIPAQTFSGVVGATSRSPFDPRSVSGRRILARTEPLDITVLAPPTDAPNWLPAKDISLEVVWSGNPNTLEVGEPMTRTIVTSAVGQQAAALPPMATEATGQYKVYADQPQMSDQPTSQALTAERRDSAAIVPSQAGEIQFPEIRIPWWDIESETWQEAVLPAETIQVAATSSTSPAAPQQLDTQGADADSLIGSQLPLVAETPTDPIWKWALGILLTLALLLGLDNLRLRRRPATDIPSESDPKNLSKKQLWKTLTASTKAAQPMEIRANLLAWADQYWPEKAPHTLHTFKAQAHSLDKYIRDLEALCSGNEAYSLNREEFLAALQSWAQADSSKDSRKDASLPELYPK